MKTKKRSGFHIMLGLIGMIKPLLLFMILAIIMGCIGNLAATFITILGGYGLINVLKLDTTMSLGLIFTITIVLAVSRGILRYAEQSCNHYIAFKLLARIRHQVFSALRKLAPAKLDGNDKGNLISIITSDIELLEVFYAHTISPIAIAIITSIVMCLFIGSMSPILGVIAALFYLVVGAIVPYINGRLGGKEGLSYRNDFGDLNTIVLDNLYGLEDILQYHQKDNRLTKLAQKTETLEATSDRLKKKENVQRIVTDSVILLAGAVATVVAGSQVMAGSLTLAQALICIIAIMSSFGPTAALSALSNDLNKTLASGERVLNLLAEQPYMEEITDKANSVSGEVVCHDVSFAYPEKGQVNILEHFNATFECNKIHGIHGKSGCGKSTLLKLIMRFYETKDGTITFGSNEVNEINTNALRSHIAYVTQETFLFHDTIENNIKVAKESATREEVIAAAKKASIHDFIESLPNGYDTKLTELGDSVSGGEKQRIGIARAFIHGSKMILLDEPTSNIDSLNEGLILKSLYEEKEDKTIILVSHRASTMGICDHVIPFETVS